LLFLKKEKQNRQHGPLSLLLFPPLGPAKRAAQPRARSHSPSLGLAEPGRATHLTPLSLSFLFLSHPLGPPPFLPTIRRPWNRGGRVVATTPATKLRSSCPEHHDLQHLPHSLEHTTCPQTPWREPHPTMATRWPRRTAPRRYKPTTSKLRGPGARVAHREHSGATGRHGEAISVAGHGGGLAVAW
jgi:hypothetical protein